MSTVNPGLPSTIAVTGGGTGDGAILDGVSSSIKATVLDLTNSNPLTAAIVDSSGNQISSFGGGTQYTEDVAAATDPIGTMGIAVRADTLSGVTSTDGDNIALRATNKGELYVKQTDAVPVTDNGGSLTVDGTVTANLAAGTNNIGDVDVLSVPAPLSTTGGGTEATALRVTIANDSTGLVSVDDNGGSITVDGSVTVSATNLDIRDIDAATDDITVHGDIGIVDQLNLTNSKPLATAIVDGNGDQITSFGGGTQYTEDAAAAANPVGTVPMLIRKDTPASEVSTDGDNIAQRGTAYGASYVTLLDTGGSPVSVGGGTQYTEGDTDATITGTAMLMEGATNALVPVQGTTADGLLVNLGTNNDVTVTGTVAVTQSGTWDEVGINDSGNSITVDDGGTTLSIDDGAGSITVDGTVTANLAAGTNNIGDVDVLTVPAPLSTTGGGTEATALRVTVANDSTGVLSVDDNGGSLTVDGTVSVSGTVTVDSELPTAAALADNAANPTAPAVGAFNMVWDGTTWDRSPGTSADGVLVNLGANNDVTASQTGTWTVQPGNTANTTAWLVSDVGATSGGLSKFHLVSAASTNATSIKASAGQVYSITAFNLNASPRYVKLHNTAGTPTAGTGVTESFLIPGNTSGAGLVINFDKGIAFSTGIGVTLVTGIADSDSTGVAANEVLINIYYK